MNPRLTFAFRFLSNSLIILLIFKLILAFQSQPEAVPLYLISWIQDAFLLLVLYGLLEFIPRKLNLIRNLPPYLFVIASATTIPYLFLYSYFIEDFIDFPVNLFAISVESAWFFIENFFNLLMLTTTVFSFGIAVLISLLFPNFTFSEKATKIIVYIIFVLFSFSLPRPLLNPVLYSIREEFLGKNDHFYGIKKLESAHVSMTAATKSAEINRTFVTYDALTFNYKRIIVFVMETVNIDMFFDSTQTKTPSFYTKHRANCQIYSNYQTSNLDSYTALIAMLNSVFVPYQAYPNEHSYAFVNQKNNLVEFFNTHQFYTAFVSSYGEQQKRFVPNFADWNEVNCMMNIDTNHLYNCSTTNKIETACEDFAIMDRILDLSKKHSKLFLFQEMVYGHSAEWESKTGEKTVDYCNRYFNAIYDSLKTYNLLDSTLLVITSDHGPRQDPSDIRNYHIPLILFSTNLTPGKNDDFISHLDFKDVILTTLCGFDEPKQRDRIFTMGNSGELVYGTVESNKSYIFINNRTLDVITNQDSLSVIKFNESYQDYIDYFESLKHE